MSENKIALLDKILFQFATTNERDLEQFLETFLVPILVELSTENEEVRKKILELTSYINQRIRTRDQCKLPIDSLLNMLESKEVSLVSKNFGVIYIEMGFNRLDLNTKKLYAPKLIRNISNQDPKNQIKLLSVTAPIFGSVFVPIDKSKHKELFEFAFNQKDKEIFLDFIQFNYLQTDSQGEALKQKSLIVQFLSSGLFSDAEIFPSLLVAKTHFRNIIANEGETYLRKITLPNLESENLIDKLFLLFLGDKNKQIPEGSNDLKIAILGYLSKSILATNRFPKTLQAIFHSIYGQSSSPKLRESGVNFVIWTIEKSNDQQFRAMAPIILSSGLAQLITIEKKVELESEQNPKLAFENKGLIETLSKNPGIKGLAYRAIGKVCQRVPDLFQSDIQIIQMFFDGFQKEQSGIVPFIREGLMLLSFAYQKSSPNVREMIRYLIENIIGLSSRSNISWIEDYRTRSVVNSFVIQVFSFNDFFARFVNLISMGDNNKEVISEAKRGLVPYQFHDRNYVAVSENDVDFPDFFAFSKFLLERLYPKQKSTVSVGLINSRVISESLKFLLLCLINNAKKQGLTIANFLAQKISSSKKEAKSNEMEIDSKTKETTNEQQFITMDLEETSKIPEPLISIHELLRTTLSSPSTNLELQFVSFNFLAVLFINSFDSFSRIYSRQKEFDFIKKFTRSNDSNTRSISSKMVGLLASRLETQRIKDLLEYHFKILVGIDQKTSLIDIHSSILVIGFTIANLYRVNWNHNFEESLENHLNRKPINITNQFSTEKTSKSQSLSQIKLWEENDPNEGKISLFSPLIKTINIFLYLAKSTDDLISTTAVKMLGVVGMFVPHFHRIFVIEELISLMKLTMNNANRLESIVNALGSISVGEQTKEIQERAADGLCGLLKHKAEDIQFSVGESLTLVFSGWDSLVIRNPFLSKDSKQNEGLFDQNEKVKLESQDYSVLEQFLETLSTKLLISGSSVVRLSASIWLFNITKYCQHHPVVIKKLENIHNSFLNLLGDQNVLIENLASKGLCFVYEMGNQNLKNLLVDSLMDTLVHGRSRKIERKEDDEIGIPEIDWEEYHAEKQKEKEKKQEEEKKKNPNQQNQNQNQNQNENQNEKEKEKEKEKQKEKKQNRNLTTYRELYSIAKEMGQPHLVYQLINIGKSEHVWNSKKASALGLTTIAQTSNEQLKPFISLILPKLYGYQFDPNHQVKTAMESVLKSLVPSIEERAKLIEQNFKPILKELISGLEDKLWRRREASCFALGDLLKGCTFSNVGENLENLLILSHRMLDDIKETVRISANTFYQTLRGVCLRFCNPEHSPNDIGIPAIEIVFKFLLSKGIQSPAQELRLLSFEMINEIARHAKDLLKPHVSEIIIALIQAMSNEEPPQLNYIQSHTSALEVSKEEFENLRLAANSISPFADTIRYCTNQIDQTNIDKLIPNIIQLAQTAVGLQSRAFIAKFFVDLVDFHSGLLSLVHLVHILRLSRQGMNDASPSLRKLYAKSLGYISNLLWQKADKNSENLEERKINVFRIEIENLLLELKQLYFDQMDQEFSREISARAIAEINKNSRSKMLIRFGKIILPLCFIGSNDSSKEIADLFQEVWSENTASKTSGIEVYFSEIYNLSLGVLGSPTWAVRKLGALSLKDVGISALTSSGIRDHLLQNSGQKMWGLIDSLVSSAGGRIWAGKEAVFEALSSLLISCKDFILFSHLNSNLTDEQQKNIVKKTFYSQLDKVVDLAKKFEKIILAFIREAKKNKNFHYKTITTKSLAIILQNFNAFLNEDLHKKIFDIMKDAIEKIEQSFISKTKTTEFFDNFEDDLDSLKGDKVNIVDYCFQCIVFSIPFHKLENFSQVQITLQYLLSKLEKSDWIMRLSILKSFQVFSSEMIFFTQQELIKSFKPEIKKILNDFIVVICDGFNDGKHSNVRSRSLELLDLFFQIHSSIDFITQESKEVIVGWLIKLQKDRVDSIKVSSSKLLFSLKK